MTRKEVIIKTLQEDITPYKFVDIWNECSTFGVVPTIWETENLEMFFERKSALDLLNMLYRYADLFSPYDDFFTVAADTGSFNSFTAESIKKSWLYEDYSEEFINFIENYKYDSDYPAINYLLEVVNQKMTEVKET